MSEEKRFSVPNSAIFLNSSIVAGFSSSAVSATSCFYKENTICWGETYLIFFAAFASTFLALVSLNMINKIIFDQTLGEILEAVITVVTIILVFNIMYHGGIWEPPGTYYFYKTYFDAKSVAIAYSYAFLFEMFKYTGILLLLIFLVFKIFGRNMRSVKSSGIVCLINWLSMKVVFFILALPALFASRTL